MNRKDEDIIWEHILKFLMFGVAVFCTGGVFFGAYIIYHLVMCDRDLQRSRAERIPIHERIQVITINKAENLTEEDKKYFYEHPNTFKIPRIKGEGYSYKCDDIHRDIQRQSEYKYYLNPRFADGEQYDCWWNKPFWDDVIIKRTKYKAERIKKDQMWINLYNENLIKYKKQLDNEEDEIKCLELSKSIEHCDKEIIKYNNSLEFYNKKYETYEYLLKEDKKQDCKSEIEK